MRILIGMPCLFGSDHTRMAIESVIDAPMTDLLMIDNGAPQDVKSIINFYHSRTDVHIISNEKNIYVNPAWNQIMKFFLEWKQYDYLIIMNSDLIMQDDWYQALQLFYSKEENKNKIPVPIVSDNIHVKDIDDTDFWKLTGGIAGVFIVLPRKVVELCYPIPESIKIWFGDNWIYDIARKNGFECGVLNNLRAMHYHNGSQNVGRVEGISELIENDKLAWVNEVNPVILSM